MLGIVGIALEFAQLAPRAIDAGISVAGLWTKIRAGLDEVAAPDDAQWQEADAAVTTLMARALDPATDSR